MKFPHPIPVRTIAQQFQIRQLIGDDTLMATGINEIHKVESGDIAFSDVKKYFSATLESDATIILLNETAECPPGKVILVTERPFEVYDALIREYRPFEPLTSPIHHQAEIHPTAVIEPGAVIGNHVRIGAHCYIQSHAYLGEYTYLGDYVQIGAGAILGTDAFYFKKHPDDTFQKWRSGGRVIIHDHVDIGAGCTSIKV